jgi:hypothetical protein
VSLHGRLTDRTSGTNNKKLHTNHVGPGVLVIPRGCCGCLEVLTSLDLFSSCCLRGYPRLQKLAVLPPFHPSQPVLESNKAAIVCSLTFCVRGCLSCCDPVQTSQPYAVRPFALSASALPASASASASALGTPCLVAGPSRFFNPSSFTLGLPFALVADAFTSIACYIDPPADGGNPQITPDVDNHGSSRPRPGKFSILHEEEDFPRPAIANLHNLTILQLLTAIKAIHYAFPAVVFLYFIAALTITVCTLQTNRLRIKDEHVRRDVILGLIFGATLTYVRPLCPARVQNCLLSGFLAEDGLS